MGAIDLLFDVKRDSERLHQLVLGALLSRTSLVDRLVPRPPRAATASRGDGARPLQFDPAGKAFDLAIGPSDDWMGTGRVFVEVKLDTPIHEDQLAQQLAPGRLHDGDRLLCLLLGYSAVTTDRAALRDRIRRIGEHSGRPDLQDRVSLRDAADLIPLLADPGLWPHAHDIHHRDARDLATAYRDALLQLTARLASYTHKPLADWGDGDFIGFYSACRDRRLIAGPPPRIGRIATADGLTLGCAFGPQVICGGQAQLDLAFEGPRLCLRLHPQPGATESRRSLRALAQAALVAHGAFLAGAAPPFVESPARLTAVMTLAQCDLLQSLTPHPGGPMADLSDGAPLTRALQAADALLRSVVTQLKT